MRGFNEQVDRRHIRREASAEEIRYLLAFVETRTSPQHIHSGPDRAMLYRIAFGTGFRANELRSLTPQSCQLEKDPPSTTVAANYSKRRREDIQPIRADLADLFRVWLQGETCLGTLVCEDAVTTSSHAAG